MRTVCVIKDKIENDLYNSADQQFLKDFRMTRNDLGQYIIVVNVEDETYFQNWVRRTNVVIVDDEKLSDKYIIQTKVGSDLSDRVADSFKLTELSLIALSDIYGCLTEKQKSNLKSETVEFLDHLKKEVDGGDAFSVQTKEEGIVYHAKKLMGREKEVAKVFKNKAERRKAKNQ